MKEYWEITHERATATLSVWGSNPAFTLNNLTLAQHESSDGQLPALAALRATAERQLEESRAERDDALAIVEEVNGRLPTLLENLLSEGDDLHDELDLVFAVSVNAGLPTELRRARLLSGVWEKYNSQAGTPLTLTWVPEPDMTAQVILQADFAAAPGIIETRLKSIANKQRDVAAVKSQLRAMERKVDRGNKRWYGAWCQVFPAGTSEGDAARSTVPTELGVPQAQALEISGVTHLGGGMHKVDFDPNTGAHATARELLRQLPGDLDFGNTVVFSGDSVIIGPLPSVTLVKLRSRVSNSNPGQVLSTVFQLLTP